MIQGTASDVGKSIISTALCRIFKEDSKQVAPFKSWNMSLNSFVTQDGGEIGIAQAIQAEAAGVEPIVDMQPILVKPRGDGLSQVIVRGKPLGDLNYNNQDHDYFTKARNIIDQSINKLKNNYDIIVMEGAGSPAEVNRKGKDLANMMVASLNNTPVFLVADIDRGGALASLVGTLRLLEPADRKLVKGLIINRFRGDFDLLKPGIEFLENYTGIPVVGVIPYLKDINLPEEDSASLKKKEVGLKQKDLKIAVISLPRISNFTDFKSLSLEADVDLSYVKSHIELDNADLIIIPGTKSTTLDLKYLKESGFADKLIELSRQQVPITGICGGYQMMGKALFDPYNTEGQITEIEGLGLLPVETRFLPEKTTHQVRARITADNNLFSKMRDEIIRGYEIHMGETRYLAKSASLFTIIERSGESIKVKDGAVADNGNSFGTYLHGVFNNDKFRRTLLDQLREIKGIPPINRNEYSYKQDIEADYDKLANIVRKNLKMDLINSIISKGV